MIVVVLILAQALNLFAMDWGEMVQGQAQILARSLRSPESCALSQTY